MHHIVFKKSQEDLHSEGCTLQGDLISCIKKQQKDFPKSFIIATYLSNGVYDEVLYKKHVQRWNQKV